MLKYDKEHNLLTFYKVQNPSMGQRFNLLRDVRDAYARFEKEGALEVCEYINEYLSTRKGCVNQFEFFAEKAQGYRNEEDHIRIKAKIRGDGIRPPIHVINLPYMDNLGKLHFHDRSVKVLVNKLTSANDISYDADRKSLSIVMSKRTVKVDCSVVTKDIQVMGKGKSKISMAELIVYLSVLEGNPKRLLDIIRNPMLITRIPQTVVYPEVIPMSQIMAIDTTGLIEGLRTNPDFGVKNIRDSINSAVTLDRAVGEVMSKSVGGYEEGTYITPTILRDLKRQRVNEIYVENLTPYPDKKIHSGLNGKLLMYSTIPAGTLNTTFLQEAMPEFADLACFTRDVRVGDTSYGEPVIDLTGRKATREVLEFVRSMGETSVYLSKGSGSIMCPLELEIIGNHTVRASDIYTEGECYKKGYDPNEWIPTAPGANGDTLTSDDLLAIYSTLGYMLLKDVNLFMDRDKDFLKKVELADVTMARALQEAIEKHMSKYGENVKGYADNLSGNKSNTDIFGELSGTLKQVLGASYMIETPDTTNLVAEISQATHITNMVKEAPEIMRQIAIPYFGRICPFETPEGKKLGLVNNKAIGCQIKDGNMMALVRKVLKVGDEITISDDIEEISVKDEVRCRITSELQLEPGSKPGYYKNTRIIAKVPNPEPTGERHKYASVYAIDLDYVYAHTEEFISPATAMIPCIAHDDAVRASFGTKMVKSAIYLLDPDKPRVQTSMYRELFNSTDAYLIRAERHGTVESVSLDLLAVLYDGDAECTEYKIDEFKVTKDSVIFMRYKVKDGDRVHPGQILADCSASTDGVYCPGKSQLTVYMSSGSNYEDAIHASSRATLDYISVGTHSMTVPRPTGSRIKKDGLYKYYKRGDIVTEIEQTDGAKGTLTKPIRANHHSGIWYSVKETNDNSKPVYEIDMLGYNKLSDGDKLSGLHGNKGVESRVDNNSVMPTLANGMVAHFLFNPHGLPSRMNTGQIIEAHLGLIAEVLNVYICTDAYNGATLDEVAMMMKFACELANCGNAGACRGICQKYNIPEEWIPVLENNMTHIMSWANTFDEYGDARIWNPKEGKWFEEKMTIGFPTVLKMKQEAEEKISARGGVLEEIYQMTSSQPPKGGALGGGQAWSEMEMWAIAAYGSSELLHEAWNEKSDNECARVNMELAAIGNPMRVPNKYNFPRALYNFIYYMQCFGLMLEDDRGRLPDTSRVTSVQHFIFNVEDIIKEEDINQRYCAVRADESSTEDMAENLVNAIFGKK